MSKTPETESVESILKARLSPSELDQVHKILYGENVEEIPLPDDVKGVCERENFAVEAYKLGPSPPEQTRPPRIVRVAVVQNSIVLPTTEPLLSQYCAIEALVEKLIDLAGSMKVKILCLQECWTAPFFFCTREKTPWCEIAEDPYTGRSTQFIARKAKQHNMVIISPILERDATHCGVLWNTAVVVGNHGNVLGTHRKNHIPSVGDFNEANYYRDGQDGWPVFETEFGRVSVNICYGRHHPLNWQAYSLNGAEIIFNPSATVGALSEPLWGIEARNAAIANGVFTAGTNRVGTEIFPNVFTSGDGKPAHTDFGHFYGSSYVAAPTGARTPGISRTKSGICIAEIDFNLCQMMRDKWMFYNTGRHADYAKLLTAYCQPTFKPQIVRDPRLAGPWDEKKDAGGDSALKE